MVAVALPNAELERILALKSVRDPTSRALFLAAVRDLGRDGVEFSLRRLQDLMRAEEHFQALLAYDQIEFLRQPAPVAEGEREFALNVQRISLEAANGFQRFLRNRNAWATDRGALDVMFRVTGLALNAIHGFVKWGHFLNEAGRITPWKQLHALYGLADSDGYAQVPFVLHAARPAFKPSVQALYLRTLILDVLSTGGLTKAQIEIADGWFASWCGDYSLDGEYSSRHHLFFVDLASDSGLHIIRRDSHGDTLRYLRMDGLKAQIEEVQAGLRQGRLYAGHGAGAVFPVEEHAALLATIEKLHQSLAAGAENRIEERTAYDDREVDVTVGYSRVLKKVAEGGSSPAPVLATGSDEAPELAPPALTLDAAPESGEAGTPAQPAHDPEVERWRVHDLSSKGYGLVVDRAVADTVMLNGLVALRNHQTGGWIVAHVVRKLANRLRGEMLIGIEVLGFKAVAVQLTPQKSGFATPALFLPGEDTSGRMDSIIVRAGEFTSDSRYTLSVGGTGYGIRLNRIIKKGADWIKVRFEVETKA